MNIDIDEAERLLSAFRQIDNELSIVYNALKSIKGRCAPDWTGDAANTVVNTLEAYSRTFTHLESDFNQTADRLQYAIQSARRVEALFK